MKQVMAAALVLAVAGLIGCGAVSDSVRAKGATKSLGATIDTDSRKITEWEVWENSLPDGTLKSVRIEVDEVRGIEVYRIDLLSHACGLEFHNRAGVGAIPIDCAVLAKNLPLAAKYITWLPAP